MKQQIELQNVRLYAFHGCLPEEALIGSEYRCDLIVDADLQAAAQSDELKDTVDYVALNKILKEEVAIRSKLIETVGMRIIRRVFAEHPSVTRTYLRLAKINPPIGGEVAEVAVVFEEERR